MVSVDACGVWMGFHFLELNMNLHFMGLRVRCLELTHSWTLLMSDCSCWDLLGMRSMSSAKRLRVLPSEKLTLSIYIRKRRRFWGTTGRSEDAKHVQSRSSRHELFSCDCPSVFNGLSGGSAQNMGVTLPTCAVINYICAMIKPRLGSNKTGFYTVWSKETDILFFFSIMSSMTRNTCT